MKEKRDHARKQEIENKQQLDMVLQRARTRPLLVDSYNSKNKSNLNMIKATQDFVNTFKEAGMKESEAVKYLDDNQKEQYEFGKFKDAQEKRYATKQAIAQKISGRQAEPKAPERDLFKAETKPDPIPKSFSSKPAPSTKKPDDKKSDGSY